LHEPSQKKTTLKTTEFREEKQHRFSGSAEAQPESRSTKAGIPANTGVSAFSFSSALAGKLAFDLIHS
jgi:hypothetical protein